VKWEDEDMSTNRLFVLAAAAALVAWSTAPALARSPGASHGSAGGSLGLGASPTRDGADAKASVKTDEKATPHRHDSKLNEHTNRGGELQGLDRADEAAGTHGQQGRDNARTRQSR